MDTVIYSTFSGMWKNSQDLDRATINVHEKSSHFWEAFKASNATQSKILKIMNMESSFKSKLTISVNKT